VKGLLYSSNIQNSSGLHPFSCDMRKGSLSKVKGGRDMKLELTILL